MTLKVGDWVKVIRCPFHPWKEKHLNKVYKVISVRESNKYAYMLNTEDYEVWRSYELEKLPKTEALAHEIAEG